MKDFGTIKYNLFPGAFPPLPFPHESLDYFAQGRMLNDACLKRLSRAVKLVSWESLSHTDDGHGFR